MSTISLAVSEDEDIKVRKRLEREEKQEFGSDVIYETLMIKTGLSPTELKEIKDIFELVDLDHSGAISSDELLTLMNTLGLRSNQMEIENMIQETDPDNTGEIDFESFVTAVSKKVQTEYTQDELKRGFRRFYTEQDGKLPMKLLIEILTNYGEPDKRLSKDEAIELIDQLTHHRDQVSSEKPGEFFDYQQFLSVYFK